MRWVRSRKKKIILWLLLLLLGFDRDVGVVTIFKCLVIWVYTTKPSKLYFMYLLLHRTLPLPHYWGAFLDWSLSLVVLCNHFVGKLQHLKFTFFCSLEANISFSVCVCVFFSFHSKSFVIFWNVSSYWFCLR